MSTQPPKRTDTLTRETVPAERPGRPASPRLDTVCGVLQNERRRLVLRYLEGRSETTQGELAEHIAARENGVAVAELTSTQRKRVYVALYQSHLPKLDEAGAVDFDSDRGTVEPGPRFAAFVDHLDRLEGDPGEGYPTRRTLAFGAGLAAAVGLGLAVQAWLGTGAAGPPVVAAGAAALSLLLRA